MRSFLLASAAAAALLSGSAFAADLPVRSSAPAFAAPAPILFSWTGFYAGLNAGYGWNNSSWRNVGAPVFTNFSTNGDGFVGGGHLGFNYQINQFVFGLEGNLDWVDVRASSLCAGGPNTCTTKQNWLADISGRAGFAADRALIYATGGVAFTEYKFSSNIPSTWGAGSRTGWTLGGGIDYAITNNWIAGLSYKYYDFGSSTSTAGGIAVKFRETENVIAARLSYKFGSPAAGAVVAKY